MCCNGVLDVGEELDGGGVAEGDPLMITYLEQVQSVSLALSGRRSVNW